MEHADPANHQEPAWYRPLVLLAALVAIAVFGLLDFATGTDLRIYPLYMVPIAVVASRTNQNLGLLASAWATAVWFASNAAAGLDLPTSVWVVNVIAQQTAFTAIVLLVAHLQRSRAAERRSARVDSLTGLLNSRAFDEVASLELERHRRHGRPMVFGYVDLDHFKQTNDSQGHSAGDAALRKAAETMRSMLRSTDVLCRVGGDEFAILLIETTTESAAPILDRICGAVAVAMQESGWAITCSIGAVGFDETPDGVDDLVRASDALMYEVKQSGGNGARIATLPSASA